MQIKQNWVENELTTLTVSTLAEGRVWTTIEKPILQNRGIPINYVE